MDARSFYNIGEITRFVSEYEELLLASQHVEKQYPLLKGPDQQGYQALSDGKKTVLILMNRSKKALQYQFDSTAEAFVNKSISDFYSEAPAVLQGEIAPAEIKVLLLE